MFERRPIPRFICGRPGELQRAQGRSTLNVTVLNICMQGCRIECRELPDIGEKCELLLSCQGRDLRFHAELRWKNDEGHGGLEFLSMDEEKAGFLARVCESLELEPLKPLPAKRRAKSAKGTRPRG